MNNFQVHWSSEHSRLFFCSWHHGQMIKSRSNSLSPIVNGIRHVVIINGCGITNTMVQNFILDSWMRTNNVTINLIHVYLNEAQNISNRPMVRATQPSWLLFDPCRCGYIHHQNAKAVVEMARFYLRDKRCIRIGNGSLLWRFDAQLLCIEFVCFFFVFIAIKSLFMSFWTSASQQKRVCITNLNFE